MNPDKLNAAKAFFSEIESTLLLNLYGDYSREIGRILATGKGDLEDAQINLAAIEEILRDRLKEGNHGSL